MRHTDTECMPKEMGWSEQEIEIKSINTLKASHESLCMSVIVSAFCYMHKFLRGFGCDVSKTIHRAAMWKTRGQASLWHSHGRSMGTL